MGEIVRKLIAIILPLLLIQQACGMKSMATHVISGIATDGMVALEGEEDVEFARQTAPALIKTLEVLRHGDLKDKRALTLLALSYGQFTFGFLEEDMLRFSEGSTEQARAERRADLFYRRGREYGIAALSRRRSMRTAFKSPFNTFKRRLRRTGKGDVPALFWTAFNWGLWTNLHRDDPSAIVDIPRIRAMIERVIELDPEYYYGSAHTFRGVLAASRPKALGGDPELAREEFTKALGLAPNYLMTKVLFAQYYARQVNDVHLFEGLLNEVLKADASDLPEQRLANELAQRRARILLDLKRRLF
jgi:tetratricopeptide (TPR) repeat protein